MRALSLALVACLFSSERALSDSAPSYCDPEERFAPEGRIVELRGRFFRICGGPNSGPPYINDPRADFQFVRIRARSSLTKTAKEALLTDLFIWGTLILRDSFLSESTRQFYSSRIGDIRFGNSDYSIYTPKSNALRHEGQVGKGNLPRNTLFVFEGSNDSNVSFHYMSCFDDPTGFQLSKYHCTLFIRYSDVDHFTIDHTLFWSPAFGGEPFDFEQLPELVRAVHFLFEQVDVTDQLDQMQHVPIVRTGDEQHN